MIFCLSASLCCCLPSSFSVLRLLLLFHPLFFVFFSFNRFRTFSPTIIFIFKVVSNLRACSSQADNPWPSTARRKHSRLTIRREREGGSFNGQENGILKLQSMELTHSGLPITMMVWENEAFQYRLRAHRQKKNSTGGFSTITIAHTNGVISHRMRMNERMAGKGTRRVPENQPDNVNPSTLMVFLCFHHRCESTLSIRNSL